VLTELENRTTPFDANQRPRADVMMALLDAAAIFVGLGSMNGSSVLLLKLVQ
jgi:hypothetical protein